MSGGRYYKLGKSAQNLAREGGNLLLNSNRTLSPVVAPVAETKTKEKQLLNRQLIEKLNNVDAFPLHKSMRSLNLQKVGSSEMKSLAGDFTLKQPLILKSPKKNLTKNILKSSQIAHGSSSKASKQ